MTVTVVDLGVGNLPNVVRAFSRLGAVVRVSRQMEEVASSPILILPGVGASPPAVQTLTRLGLDRAIRQAVRSGAWLLGICLGHQLLFQQLTEFGSHAGLGLLPGVVKHLPEGLRTPHMGWAQVNPCRPGFASLAQRWFFFVHSYAAHPESKDLLATVQHQGHSICAAVWRGRVVGVQFHPEKSGPAGADFLREFLEKAA